MRLHFQGVLILAVVTVLWGTTFVVVKVAVGSLAPSLLVLLRFAIAAVLFLPWLRRDVGLWLAGLELGFWLWLGYASQTVGLTYTTADRSAFITALSVVMVPLIASRFGRRIGPVIWFSAILSLVGVGLLSHAGAPPNLGDLLTFVTALAYAGYILRLETYVVRYEALPLTAVQLVGVLPLTAIWVGLDHPSFTSIPWATVIYLGLVTTALSTWLQVLGQGRVSATEAAVIYTLEPVWASIFSFFLLRETLGVYGAVGAGLIVLATLFSQWPRVRRRVS